MNRVPHVVRQQWEARSEDRTEYPAEPANAPVSDAHDTYYYEREWRLGAQSLPTEAEWNRPNALYHCIQEGYPQYLGRRIIKGDNEYFSFLPEYVAFLIAPRSSLASIANPRGFTIHAFEDIVA